MAKEITMPERQDEPSQAEVDKMGAEECALAIRGKLDSYRRSHGLQTNAGLGMMLLARAMQLLNQAVAGVADPLPPEVTGTPELIEAVRALYYSAVWVPDRLINGTELWTAVRDAAGFSPGSTDTIPPSGNAVFVVPMKYQAMIQQTLDYLRQTDPL